MKLRHDRRRKFTVRFKDAVPTAAVRPMLTTLRDMDGVEAVQLVAGRLTMTYRFPGTGMPAILTALEEVAGGTRQQPLNRLLNHCRAFMEKNERDNLLSACGWHRYIEDIYMRHFDAGLNARIDIRKQTWRKYK